jgi:hypothetical protein
METHEKGRQKETKIKNLSVEVFTTVVVHFVAYDLGCCGKVRPRTGHGSPEGE